MKKAVSNVINGFEIKFIERNEKEKKGDVEIRFFISGRYLTSKTFSEVSFSTVEKMRRKLLEDTQYNYSIESHSQAIFLLTMLVHLEAIARNDYNYETEKSNSNVINGFEILEYNCDGKEKIEDIVIRLLKSGEDYVTVKYSKVSFSVVEELRMKLLGYTHYNFSVEIQCQSIAMLTLLSIIEDIVKNNR